MILYLKLGINAPITCFFIKWSKYCDAKGYISESIVASQAVVYTGILLHAIIAMVFDSLEIGKLLMHSLHLDV